MTEPTIRAQTVYQGRIFRVEDIEVRLPNGRSAHRQVVRHPGAAVVLAQLPDDRFVFVQHYRKAIDQSLIEVVAGTLHPGESPEACARRELREESGYEAESLISFGVILPAPGYTDERMHLFFARLHPTPNPLPQDDDESVNVLYLTADEVDRLIANGSLQDAKTLVAWLFYRRQVTP
jgi:ADP-ribose pyrophosphatase